jgi:hypothetical protein
MEDKLDNMHFHKEIKHSETELDGKDLCPINNDN